jgi:hypothetical protein
MIEDFETKAQKLRDVLRETFGAALSEQQIEAIVQKALQEARKSTEHY